jgi:cell division transport system permease protein
MSTKLAAYGERHAQVLFGALGRIAHQPFSTVMIVGVIGIALALPLCLALLIQNARQASGSWTEALDLTVYLDTKIPEAGARAIADRIKSRSDIAAVTLVTADQALQEFREKSGFGPALDVLKENPLPNVIVVSPTLAVSAADGAQGLQKDLAGIAGVATVQVDTAWVKRFHAMLDVLHRLTAMAAAILVAGVVLVVGNTIRLDILNRRNEIEVMKLVGGTDGFARRPFLYSGALYGLGGGVLAVCLVALAEQLLSGPVEHLTSLYGSSFRLSGLGWNLGLATVGGSAGLGWLGSLIAATRHIRGIEPT